MKLEMATFQIKDACWAEKPELRASQLFINKRELENSLSQDKRLGEVNLEIAKPGERTRIVHVLDVIEPRTKFSGPGTIFPGFLGPPKTVGQGLTHRLSGLAVVETGEFSREGRGLLAPWEHIIDMSGPGASYSPFSRLINVVVSFEPRPGVSLEEYDNAVRLAGLKLADYLAGLSRQCQPDALEAFELGLANPSLPGLGYIHQCASEGVLHNTFLYGEPIPFTTPTLIHPNELSDGALVSGKYGINNPTYVYLNDPVVGQLYRLHGTEANFLGVALTCGGGTNKTDFAKGRDAEYVAKLMKLLGADGVVLVQEGGGNSIMDQMLICQACEEMGIKTTLISYEMGGTEGTDVPLIFTVPQANAIVSTGNREEKLRLPAMEKVLGGDKLLYTDIDAWGEIEVYVDYLASSIDQAGSHNLKGWEY